MPVPRCLPNSELAAALAAAGGQRERVDVVARCRTACPPLNVPTRRARKAPTAAAEGR